MPIGLGIYLRAPKIYLASSLLSYQNQISSNKLAPDLDGRTRDIVYTLSQIVYSRSNLEQIIVDLDLYPEERKIQPIENVIALFRNNIEIIPDTKGNLFTVSYYGGDPEKVVKATNAIAAKFIEENLRYRQERASDTSAYTNQELQMAKSVMDKQDEILRDYKLKNYNEMPEHREANMSRLTALQGQYQDKQVSIQDLERTLVLIQDQINNQRMLIRQTPVSVETVDEPDSFQRLANLRATLDSLLLKYTEKHPEIIRIRKLIEKMEAEIQNGELAGTGTSGDNSPVQNVTYNNTLMSLELQRKDVRLKIAKLENEKVQLQKEIEQVEKWVAAAPIREAEWASLTREYGQLKKHYDYLVSQNLQAESMLNLEERQRGSQFKIEEPARYSGKPIEPNFFMTVGMSILAGFGLGVLIAFILDFFDSSFRDPETVSPTLGLPLLITIPYIETQAEQRRSTWQTVLTVGVLGVCFSFVVMMFSIAWQRGYIIL
jgi:polysaccharide chain length determinant protein (PEP-CTERM system associated)